MAARGGAVAKKPYYDSIRSMLHAALCLSNFPSMKVECHNKPEIEMPSAKEVIMTPYILSRSEGEKVMIEPSINSIRLSVRVQQPDSLTSVLVDRYARFLMLRAEQFKILRRKPMDGYDVSFLITNTHMETFLREQLVDFLVDFIATVDAQVSLLKLSVNMRARKVGEQILKNFV